MTDANRAWTKRWQAERNAPGKFPTMVQAGVYSAVTHYLKAVAALKSAADGKAVVAEMKKLPTDDPLFGKGTIRVDGRKMHPAYLFEVKKPAESKYPGDFYKLRATIPADEAFRPLKDGDCPLVKRLARLSGAARGERSTPSLSGRSERGSPRASRRHRPSTRATRERPYVRNLRHPIAGAVRPAPDRADQRLVLCAAEPRASP